MSLLSATGTSFLSEIGANLSDAIPAGEFERGADDLQESGSHRQRVTVSQPYKLMRTPATNDQMEEFYWQAWCQSLGPTLGA